MDATGRGGLLASSVDQGIRYDERSTPEFQAARLREACATVGCADGAWRHFASNRNAELYRIGAADGSGALLLKVLISKPAETLEQEYRSLTDLHGIAQHTGKFRVPRPVALFEGRSAYLMEWVDGSGLDAELRGCPDPASRLDVLHACGSAVAAVHHAWSRGSAPLDGEALRRDLTCLPWAARPRERELVERAVARIDGASFPAARLYLDCDPVNVRLAGASRTVVLLDPPERDVIDSVHWDLGAFLFGLHRLAWKWPPAASRIRRAQPRMREAFLEGYAGPAALSSAPDRVLLALAELVRLAQLWSWWLRPLGFRHRAAGLGRAAYGYPLLARARRRAYRALGHTLDAAS